MISGCAKCEVGRCFACVHYEHFAVDFFACRLNIFIVFLFFFVWFLVSLAMCHLTFPHGTEVFIEFGGTLPRWLPSNLFPSQIA